MKFKFGKLPIKYAPNSKVCELSVLECFRLAIGFFTTKHGNESMLPYTNPLALDVIFHSCWIDFQIQFKCDIIILHSFLELLQGGLLQLHSPTHKDQLDFRIIGLIRKLRLKSLSYKALRWGTSSAPTGYGWMHDCGLSYVTRTEVKCCKDTPSAPMGLDGVKDSEL
jgi:hypothetical protein